MKFNLFIIFIFLILLSCVPNVKNDIKKTSYSGIGFAYIYNDEDFVNKVISKKFNNEKLIFAHQYLKIGTLVKITNLVNKKSLTLEVSKKSKYPDFYKILITRAVADKIGLSFKVPLIEIFEISKNETFVAKKATMFNEEKKIFKSAPVMKVKIDNLSKIEKKKKTAINNFSILIAEFYSKESAKTLKKKLINELSNLHYKKVKIKKKTNAHMLYMGPYNAVNSLKKDYIILRNYGFEELEILVNE